MTRQGEGKTLLSLWQEGSVDDDGFRRLLERVVQQVLHAEISEFIGAAPHQRTDARRGYRNGYVHRGLTTRVGRLELRVPRDREGRFQSELFERYQRSEKALLLAVAQMYVEGVSTRKVKRITEQLCGHELSKSQVSALAKNLDEELHAWRSRPLEGSYPYVVVDARYEKIRRAHRVVSQGVLIVVGISEEGYREVLGVWVAESESEAIWSSVFHELCERGLRGVRYVVSDDHKGLRLAIARHFQGAAWQRCQVHFIRNVLGRVRAKDRSWVVRLLRQLTEAPDEQTARRRLGEIVEELSARYPAIAERIDAEGEEMLSVYQLPESHRRRLRSTNMLERFHQELKRRTRVVRIFPDEASCLRLVTALAIETSEEWMERRYLNMGDSQQGEASQRQRERAA